MEELQAVLSALIYPVHLILRSFHLILSYLREVTEKMQSSFEKKDAEEEKRKAEELRGCVEEEEVFYGLLDDISYKVEEARRIDLESNLEESQTIKD
eukprot:scaffold5488_cov160-Ochromonas_danica.AAC.1